MVQMCNKYFFFLIDWDTNHREDSARGVFFYAWLKLIFIRLQRGRFQVVSNKIQMEKSILTLLYPRLSWDCWENHLPPISRFGEKGVDEQIKQCDKITKYLLDKLDKFKLTNKMNLFVLSDHGMNSVKLEDIIDLTQFINSTHVKFAGGSPTLGIFPAKSKWYLLKN